MTTITDPLPKRIPGAALNREQHANTNEPITAEYLATIQTRVDAANPLPWALVPRDCPEHGPYFDLHGGAVSNNPADWWLNEITSHNGGPDCTDGYPLTEANAEFLVHAREDVPALLAEIKRLRGACNNPDFTCLSGEYCDGCQASDDARTAMERELRDLRDENAKLRMALAEQKQISAILDDYAMGYKP
jgi:hypothetical protein